MNTNAKKRSDNWSAEDKLLLQELIKERVSILENKNTDTNSNTRKIAAWADLEISCNIMRSGAERTVGQLKSQWKTMKSTEKKKISTEKKARLMTGGGPPPREDPAAADANSIRVWLPQEFATDSNEFDSDTVNQIVVDTATSTVAAVQSVETPAFEPAAAPAAEIPVRETSQAPQAQPAGEGEATQQSTSKRNRKRKTVRASGRPVGQPAVDIAMNEIKCRQELHKMQMENEERRKRILDF